MEGTRILIVENDQPLRAEMAEHLREQRDIALIKEARNGIEALKLLSCEKFDLVVTDTIMPLMDGYTLLDELRRRVTPLPKIIVISALARDDFVTRAIDSGASFYMVKPLDLQCLTRRIRELTGGLRLVEAPPVRRELYKTQTVDERLGRLFLTMGIPAHIKGYQYLRCGIKMVVDQPDMINRITKELYPSIAKHYGTTTSKVERAIRHAIEVAWNRGRVDTLNHAFGCRVCTPEDKPTNGEFIAMIADKLSMERSA